MWYLQDLVSGPQPAIFRRRPFLVHLVDDDGPLGEGREREWNILSVCAVSVPVGPSFQRFKGHPRAGEGLGVSAASLRTPRFRVRTSRVSQPPTMLRPSPVRPLQMSMVVSQPGMMGHVAGSQVRADGVDERLWAADARDSHSAPLLTCMTLLERNRTYIDPPPPPGESG